jgi:hypothetical protein
MVLGLVRNRRCLPRLSKIVDLRPTQKPCITNQAYTCVFVVIPRSMEARRPTHSHGGAVPSTCLQTVAMDHPAATEHSTVVGVAIEMIVASIDSGALLPGPVIIRSGTVAPDGLPGDVQHLAGPPARVRQGGARTIRRRAPCMSDIPPRALILHGFTSVGCVLRRFFAS